jgi:hypothetical protein
MERVTIRTQDVPHRGNMEMLFLEVCTMPCHGVVVEDDNYHPLGRGNGVCHGM